MTDWYISSAVYGTHNAWLPTHLYVIGDLVIPTAPALRAKYAFRVTTGGTSGGTEPVWPIANNGTITNGSVVFTNVTGQSAFSWSAAAGDFPTIQNRFIPGDRLFFSSDHTETQLAATSYSYIGFTVSWATTLFLSVNRSGSTPPVAADLQAGATCIVDTNGLTIDNVTEAYYFGMTFVTTSTGSIFLGTQQDCATQHFRNCVLWLNHTGNASAIRTSAGYTSAPIVLENTFMQFGNEAQGVSAAGGSTTMGELMWRGGGVQGITFPSQLFIGQGASNGFLLTARGVDLSNITGRLVGHSGPGLSKYLFESCKISPNVVRYNNSGVGNSRDLVALCNCSDGTRLNLSELHQPAGSVTTDISTVILGGAADDVSPYTHKMTTNANVNRWVSPLQGFWLDVENVPTGVTRTAIVEIISSGGLNNDDVHLWLEYEGTSGSSVTTITTSMPSTVLTAATALPTSTTPTWLNPPASAVKQKLQVSFIAQHAGRIHAQVRLGKANTTCWYNPQVVLT